MIYPDSFVAGVLLAMTELGLRPPGDLRLAYHPPILKILLKICVLG